MFYEINVAKNGVHFFATSERSITDKMKLEKVLKVFKEKFPESEGFSLSVTYWETRGQALDIESLF